MLAHNIKKGWFGQKSGRLPVEIVSTYNINMGLPGLFAYIIYIINDVYIDLLVYKRLIFLGNTSLNQYYNGFELNQNQVLILLNSIFCY